MQDAKAEAENRLMLTSDKYRQATPAERASMLADDATYHEQIKTWGVGGTVPMAITAVTAAFSGITAGNLGAAASGAMAPYIARQIKAATGDNVIANAMAHAVEGAVLAQMAGNSATAGAIGAAGGELIARSIVATLYPGVEAQNLTEEQKHIVSALSQISSGILGGLEGNSVAAIATAQVAGKNAVENNLLGGNEESQTKFVQEHGKDVLSCSTDPGSASCQKGLAMNDALMIALPAGLGGGLLAAATPEIAAAAQAAIQSCAGNVVLCLNNAGIQMSEALVPGGVGAGGAVGIGKTAAEATAAKAEAVAANVAKNSQLPTGTVFDSIKGTQSVYPGSVIPKSFEMSLPNGQKVWVHGNATEHMAEYAASKAVTHTPEAVRLASQEELRSFQAAVNTATKNNMPYGERITVDGWQLEIKPPRAAGELPTIIHARYVGAH